MIDLNEGCFSRDLTKFFDLKDLFRTLDILEVSLAPESRARRRAKWNKRIQAELVADLWKQFLAVSLDKRIQKDELTEFISRCATKRIASSPPNSSESPELLRRVGRAIGEAHAELGKHPRSVDKTFCFFRTALQREVSTEGYVLLADSLSSKDRNNSKVTELVKGTRAISVPLA